MRRAVAALVALVALPQAGCLLGPDYRRPVVEAPPAFRFEMAQAREVANTAWWTQFQDPVLERLVAEALAHNLGVAIAAANVEQAAALLTQARAPLYPQIDYGAEGARSKPTEAGAVPLPSRLADPQTSYQVLAGASWELDLWGRIRRLSEAARAQMLASEAARRGVVLSLVASVAGGYVQLRALDEQLVIATRTRQAYADSVRLFELQYKYGLKSRMTVEQARTQFETAAAAIPQLEIAIAQAENALSVLLGRNPGPIERGLSIDEIALPVVPAGLPSGLLERRPDLLEAEQQLVAANAQIGAARALYYPSISLTGALGQASAALQDLFQGSARVWSYAGSLVGPIFTGGAVSGQVRQAEAQQQAAELAYRLAIQNAFADVDDALIERQKLVEQLQALERLVAASSEYARLAQLQFDGGVTPYVTVLQAQQQLFPAELNRVQARASLLVAAVRIYAATGGGWVETADRLTR